MTLDSRVIGGFSLDATVAAGTATAVTDFSGSGITNLSFEGNAGETKEVFVTPVSDTEDETDETVLVSMSNLVTGATNNVTITDQGTITILNDDNDPPVATGTAITGLTQVGQTLTGSYTYSDDENDPESGTTLQWYTGNQLVPISGATTTTLTLSDDLVGKNIIFGVTPANGVSTGLESTSEAVGPVQALPKVGFAAATASGVESIATASIEISLDQAGLVASTVDYTITGTAIAGTDFNLAAGTLNFAAGDISETIGLSIVDDLLIEEDETVIITLSNPSEASMGTELVHTYTIVNDDFNNAPTDITLSATSIAENGAMDATIGTFTTTDADAGDTHTYSLATGAGSEDNGFFVLTGNELTATRSFNFEFKPTYGIRVQTDDGNGGVFAKAITITITDVNEAPFQVSISNRTITESDEAQDVGVLMTLDPDAGETFTYEFIEGQQSAHNAQFEIVGSTIRTAGAINFEEGASRDFRIKVTDSGGLSFEWGFTVIIEDVVEEPVRVYTTNVPDGDVKNVFSPNGDGVNETWVIDDLQDNPVNEVKVFAQGGKLIYSRVNYRNDWDGTFKNEPVPDGTYYYEIIVFENSQTNTPAAVIKGFLTIIRTR